MTDQVIDDESNEAHLAGIFGVKRHEPKDGSITAIYPPTNPSPTFDATLGLKKFGMQGNAKWGNCFWAAVAHARMLQALVSVLNGVPTYVEGFVPPSPTEAVTWFETYLKSQGLPTTPPGSGTGIYSGVTSMLAQGLATYAGVLGPDTAINGTPAFSANLVHQAIEDFQGGVILCLALDPKAQIEFQDHEAWGTLSTKPDAQMGHAVTGAAYTLTDDECITWGAPQLMTAQFDTSCIDGLVLLTTPALETKGVDVEALATKWGLTPAPIKVQPVQSGVFDDLKHDVHSFVSEKHFDDVAKQAKKIVEMAANREAENLVLHEIVVLLKIALKDDVL